MYQNILNSDKGKLYITRLAGLLQPEGGVMCINKVYNKRSIYGIDSRKLIMNFY